MIEIFRDPDYSRVLLFQSLLGNEGIETGMINGAPGFNGLAGPARPELYPALLLADPKQETAARELIALWTSPGSSESE